MTQYISIMPHEVSVMIYEPSKAVITIGTEYKDIELTDKNLDYFEYLVDCAKEDALMMIDVTEKLEKSKEDDCYRQCIAIYQKHVICMEYNTDENGSVIITTDAGTLTTNNYTMDEFKNLQKNVLKNKCVMIKKAVAENFEIPDFSKIKKLKN